MDFPFLQSLLQNVEKPAQYLGNEVNAVHKDFATQKLRVCLIFPDKYEVGMSHMGLKILYDILNNIEGVVAERCFAPNSDFEKILREHNIPLFSLESKTPLREFDIVGISLPYELTYTNILNILDLAQIPLWQKDRDDSFPIILGGGTGSYNPEPVADFFDAIAIGDAEELIVEIADQMIGWKNSFGIDKISTNKKIGSRQKLLDAISNLVGAYVPSFFVPEYNDDGTLKVMRPLKSNYTSVQKRVVTDLDAQPYPTKLILPNIKLVHDRIGIEIQRGCTRMCRFCQAGYIERPTRQRSPEKVLQIARESYDKTGIDEISLLSLSAGDYQTIVPTLKALNKEYSDRRVSISVPATRTETLTPELIAQVKKVRATGFTIAPEAGSERMRRVINKGNKVEDLLKACHNAFSAGYRLIKFYYLCGLPFEHDEDVIGIAKEAGLALDIGLEYNRNVELNVSVSSFVPKPFTPFQWDPQMTIAETKRKHDLVRKNLKSRRLHFKCHVPEMSFLEGVFSRGDRRLAAILEKAFQAGCRFDEWNEHFNFSLWQKVFDDTKLDLDFYVHRQRSQDEVLPWDHLFSQMLKSWLWQERENARLEAYVADCSLEKCAQFCGACDFKTVKNKIYVIDDNEVAAKKGNREWRGRFGKNSPSPTAPENISIESPETKERHRLRVYFAKTGLAALYGHLELMGHLKRSLLRISVPVCYSDGFHPQMKMAMGYAVPVGLESTCESFDLGLSKPVDHEKFVALMNETLPDGLVIQRTEDIDLRAPSLYSLTEAVDYEARFPTSLTKSIRDLVSQKLTALKTGEVIPIQRRGKPGKKERTFSLGDCLKGGDFVTEDVLAFSTKVDPEGSLKPSEVLKALTGLSDQDLTRIQIKKVRIHYGQRNYHECHTGGNPDRPLH